jgi:hypothetical protein
VCTCANRDIARNLPEDVLRNCTILQDHSFVGGLVEVASHLNDKDVGCTAMEVDVIGNTDACAEGVDARRQWSGLAAERGTIEDSISEIDPRAIGVGASRGIGVRGLHVENRCALSPSLTSCSDVENISSPTIPLVKSKPVMAKSKMGETAILPVITEAGTLVMPVFARIT